MDHLRRCYFRPYRAGDGPFFMLDMWDTGLSDYRGQPYIRYELTMRSEGEPVVLFAGEDFSGSPMHSIDSDNTVEGLMGFLTLRPGDTDPEYFDGYTSDQIDFCNEHAEALEVECMFRFGDHIE